MQKRMRGATGAVGCLVAATLATDSTADDNFKTSFDRPIGNWATMRQHDRFTDRHVGSAVVLSRTAPPFLSFTCSGRFGPDAVADDRGEDFLKFVREEVPNDELGNVLEMRMIVGHARRWPKGSAELSIRVDGDMLYERVEVEVGEHAVQTVVLMRFVEALREGSTLKVRVETEDGERRTGVFAVEGFARAYRWLKGACPFRGVRSE